jgi:hypothetical protein
MPIPVLATITSRRPKRSSAVSIIAGPPSSTLYVMVKKDRFAPGATNLLRYRPTCGIFQVGYDGLGAASRECRRARGADSRCAAGYDRDLGVHLAHSVLQSAERRKFIADRQSDYAERSARKKVAGRFRKSAEQPAGPETARTPRSRVGSLPSGCH